MSVTILPVFFLCGYWDLVGRWGEGGGGWGGGVGRSVEFKSYIIFFFSQASVLASLNYAGVQFYW